MKITSVRIQNWKSFADSGKVELADINVIVGRNNSGKSAFLRAVHLMQSGSDPQTSDIRLQAEEGEVLLGLTSSRMEHDVCRHWHYNYNLDERDTLHFAIELSRRPQNQGTNANIGLGFNEIEDSGTPGLIPASEPNNFIYPYFSKRKVVAFDPQIDERRTLEVAPDLRNLAAKVARLNNPAYDGYEEYARLCEQVLGFQVGTYGSSGGQKAGVSVGRYDHIPIEAMGEGVASQLGLIVDLCMADGNLFLIEEPENDIHPEGLKTLLRVINEKAANNQFIITTHSNVVVKNLGAESRLFTVELEFTPKTVPTSTIKQVENTPQARIAVLRQLGYELYDLDLHDGWLFLEESSAQIIIRNYLIPWFVPRLARIQTVAVNGVTNMEPSFEDFRRLFLFAHLEPQYKDRAWVVVDGDAPGQKAVEKLKTKYPSWSSNHFRTWTEENFERYYPAKFAERVSEVLALPRDRKRDAKKELLDDVKQWCDSNREEAQAALGESASEVIQLLKEIDLTLFGEETGGL
jgi:hypothetical protein